THPEVADLLCRIARVMIQDLYEPISPKVLTPQLQKDANFVYKYLSRKDPKSKINVVGTLSP
ncbi:hypothetical protein BGZ94_005932, partial [Podila epigama]